MRMEPPDLETALGLQRAIATPKAWADAYLAAFADAAGLMLVTFDKALTAKAKGALLLS